MSWFRLIRWNNLLIILLTQWMAWWCVVTPLENHWNVHLLLSPFNFSLLCLSTILIAAAGYVINDYFDLRIDAINKPDKVILEKRIPRRMAIIVHSVMNVLALVLAGYVALKAHHPEWLLLQLGCTFLLWRYSTTFKRRFLTGNVVVALMTALTIVAVGLYEPNVASYLFRSALIRRAGAMVQVNPVYVLAFFTFFAFLLTWMREIVKDMEDLKGDEAEGCETMPIRWGLLKTVRFVQLLSAVAILLLSYAGYRLLFYTDLKFYTGLYMLVVLVLPLLIWTIKLAVRATSAHYHNSSRWLKIIMVLGIGSLILYRLQYG